MPSGDRLGLFAGWQLANLHHDNDAADAHIDRMDKTDDTRPTAPRRDPLIGICLGLALPLFVTGLLLPAISLQQLFLFETSFSLWQAMFALLDQGEIFLFAVMGLFSVIFPGAKILLGGWLWLHIQPAGRRVKRLITAFSLASRWSMLDVFIVAVTILLVEGTLISTASVQPGIIMFAGAVVLSTIATHRLHHAIAHPTPSA
ncbi:MAG: paraquat-inducible protein A [Rhodospirillales bacterium]